MIFGNGLLPASHAFGPNQAFFQKVPFVCLHYPLYSNNQDQLILLIKIIQACGVDIDNLIDEYNNNINNDYLYDNNSKSFTDNESISELDIKAESNSFIPITLEKEHKTKIFKIKIPKLNLDKINKKNLYNINFNNNKK